MRFPGFEDSFWTNSKIGEILKIGSGRDYKHLQEGNIPVFGTGGYMTSVNEYLFDGETVCIGRKGTINKPFYYNGKLWTVDTLFYTHSYKDIIPKFLFYVFEQINWLKYNEASGVPSLSKNTIEQIDVFIPSKNEQNKIASLLSLLDNRIQTQTKIIEELESLSKGLREKLFSQQLRFKDDKGNEFPDWEEKKLEYVCEKKSSNISANKIENNFGEYIIYGASGILKKVDFYEEESDYISIVKDGAGVGRLFYCKGKSSVLGTMDIIKPSKSINTYFLFCLLSNIDFTAYVTGSTIPHIYFKDYKKERLIIPSMGEQLKISSFLSSINQKINIGKKSLQQYEHQKKYFLQNMFI
ncbi:restriction endonuclease subunit S [Ferruginibacter sp. SUN002]|uniref:restriction endonuclease subunit S n=1 Tax=Ferruginibacter sp. SUN002 TaxID=2937789 RepID=UPI003D35E10D